MLWKMLPNSQWKVKNSGKADIFMCVCPVCCGLSLKQCKPSVGASWCQMFQHQERVWWIWCIQELEVFTQSIKDSKAINLPIWLPGSCKPFAIASQSHLTPQCLLQSSLHLNPYHNIFYWLFRLTLRWTLVPFLFLTQYTSHSKGIHLEEIKKVST